jgi:hypothetical protein
MERLGWGRIVNLGATSGFVRSLEGEEVSKMALPQGAAQSGVPRSMKMGTTRSPRHYDAVLNSTRFP